MFEFIITLGLAILLGLAIGLERTYAHKTAGMRTYALVTLAGALFMVINRSLIEMYGVESLDTARIVAALISGIGFLGAGIIIFRENHLSNLTTAAGIWVAVAVGVFVGMGLFAEACIATLMILFVLRIVSYGEHVLREQLIDTESENHDHEQ